MMDLKRLVQESLAEDIGHGDVTTKLTIPEDARCHARLHAKQDGVISGLEVFRRVFDYLDADITEWQGISDGDAFSDGDVILTFEGKARALLMGERVALNFIQRLSGVSTLTAEYVAALKGVDAKVVDTRKTTPGLRSLEKQAVMHGGGANHRYALFDGVLIKENHILAAGGIAIAVQRAIDGTHHLMKIEVEVTNLDELDQAVAAGADAVLLDNMDNQDLCAAVKRTKDTPVILEASGNVTLERIRAIAETGVHYISVGALTHSAPAVDVSLILSNA